MSVTPKGKKWFADFTVDGQRYRKSKPTEVEAVAWEAEVKRRIALGLPVEDLTESKTVGMTLRELFNKAHERYWNNTKNEDNVIYLQKQLETFYGHQAPVHSITTSRIDDFILSCQDKGLAPSTINRKLAVLSKSLKFAHARGYIKSMPSIERMSVVGNQRMRFLTPEEEQEIIEVLEHRDQWHFARFFEWSIDTGLRPSESRELTAKALSHDDDLGWIITVRITKTSIPRVIPLTERAYNAFCQISDDLYRFSKFTKQEIRKCWALVRQELNEDDPDFVFYTTRHTCASRLVQRNVPLQIVKEWMGHKTFDMTLRYAKLAPKNMLSAKQALEPQPTI